MKGRVLSRFFIYNVSKFLKQLASECIWFQCFCFSCGGKLCSFSILKPGHSLIPWNWYMIQHQSWNRNQTEKYISHAVNSCMNQNLYSLLIYQMTVNVMSLQCIITKFGISLQLYGGFYCLLACFGFVSFSQIGLISFIFRQTAVITHYLYDYQHQTADLCCVLNHVLLCTLRTWVMCKFWQVSVVLNQTWLLHTRNDDFS